MKEQFPAKMLRIHFLESDRWQGKPLHEAIVHRCKELGVMGVTVYRALEGFGASARIHHARTLSISKNAPIMVEVIDSEERLNTLIRFLDEAIGGGLVAVSSVDVIRYLRSDGGEGEK